MAKEEDDRKGHLREFINARRESKEPKEIIPTDKTIENEPSEDSNTVQYEHLPVRDTLDPPQISAWASSNEQLSPIVTQKSQAIAETEGPQPLFIKTHQDRSLVTASTAVTSRLHKHWIRPCDACAEPPKSKPLPKKLVKKPQRSVNEATETMVRPTALYHHSLFWINKQKEHRNQLRG